MCEKLFIYNNSRKQNASIMYMSPKVRKETLVTQNLFHNRFIIRRYLSFTYIFNLRDVRQEKNRGNMKCTLPTKVNK